MICPRCAKEIPDTETLCPFCMQEIDRNFEFNNFREDGFVQIRAKDSANVSENQNYKPKYFDISEYNIFVIAIIFVLAVSVFTVFSLRFVQKRNAVEQKIPKYISTQAPTEAPTEKPTEIPNSIKKQEIKNLYGSWKLSTDEEEKYNAVPYYTFVEGGYLQENYGTIIVKGTFKDISDKDEAGVYLSIDSGIKGAYDFTVKGNNKDGYYLTLVNRSSGNTYVFKKTDAQMKKLGTISGYRTDRKLLGSWLTKDKKKGYKFNKNGRMERKSGNTYTYGVYTVDTKGEVTIKYMKDQISTVNLDYKVSPDGKKLTINNVTYYKTSKKAAKKKSR